MSSEGERRDRFEAVVAEVHDPLQRYIRRRVTGVEAGDVLSDVLLTVWRRLEDAPEGAILPWSYGIARRTLSNHRRAASRHLKLVERLESERALAREDDPAGQLEDPELVAALASLPAADQEILRLWAWEQLEPREIALTLGSTANAVSLRLSRARKKLADAMTRQDPPTPGHKGDETAKENRR
ncbi:MAG TPA: sigma-70 family RNA polymerase sigma factor [Acidimicrobiia bacterium]|nr:sigma-70 family RNA polymerase sigma factor [Acidimicrobiia bacterium]